MSQIAAVYARGDGPFEEPAELTTFVTHLVRVVGAFEEIEIDLFDRDRTTTLFRELVKRAV